MLDQPQRAEVGHHPAVEDAEEDARADAAEDPAQVQEREEGHDGAEAGRGVQQAEDHAHGLPAVLVRQGADEVGADGAGQEAGGEEAGHCSLRERVLVAIQRVEVRALGKFPGSVYYGEGSFFSGNSNSKARPT